MQYTLAYSWTLLSTPVSLASYQILPRTPFHIITRALQGRKRGKKPHPTWEQASFQHQRCFSEPRKCLGGQEKKGFWLPLSLIYKEREVTQKYKEFLVLLYINTSSSPQYSCSSEVFQDYPQVQMGTNKYIREHQHRRMQLTLGLLQNAPEPVSYKQKHHIQTPCQQAKTVPKPSNKRFLLPGLSCRSGRLSYVFFFRSFQRQK